MSKLLGFISYAHDDDDVDGGRVAQLGRDIAAHYAAITTESIELFLDNDHLHWGDLWKEKIDEALTNVAFFVPVVTPRYFKSGQCMRELKYFVDKANQWGTRKVILPILYIEVPEFQNEVPADPQMQIIKKIQWRPWIDLRMADLPSREYRSGVFNLAQEIVRRVADIAATDIAAAATEYKEDLVRRIVSAAAGESVITATLTGSAEVQRATAGDGSGGELGTLDFLAAMEMAMLRITSVLEELTKEITAIGNIMGKGAKDMERGDKQGRGFAARLTVARRIAGQLSEPVDRIQDLGQKYGSDLNEIDSGFKVLLPLLANEVKANPALRQNTCVYLETVRGMADSSRGALEGISVMIQTSESTEMMSKDLRAPMRKLRNSLMTIRDTQGIMDNWLVLIDSSGIDCSSDE